MADASPPVFLSYAHEDIGMAKRVYSDLRRYGVDIWLDTESLMPGDNWRDRIQDAIENSRYFLALLSPQSISKKGFVQKELKTALQVLDLFPDSESYIIPVRLCECKIKNRRLRERQWVDLFPEQHYEAGIQKILQVVSPESFIVRNEAAELASNAVNAMLRKHGYYDHDRNPQGRGLAHSYRSYSHGPNCVVDGATGLVWQKRGSPDHLTFEEASAYVAHLDHTSFAGCADWRLPTLDEAMSLMEAEKPSHRHIDPVFDERQSRIWTCDSYQGEDFRNAWVVYYDGGYCSFLLLDEGYYVRAVRSTD